MQSDTQHGSIAEFLICRLGVACALCTCTCAGQIQDLTLRNTPALPPSTDPEAVRWCLPPDVGAVVAGVKAWRM
jgi:hypothetical protein